MNYEDIVLNHKCAKAYEWDKWRDEIPQLSFHSNWLIRIVPPFGGAIIRFRVSTSENPTNDISVYLDCYDNLGSNGAPYWEIYPFDEDTFRCAMHDTESLLKHISLALDGYKSKKE